MLRDVSIWSKFSPRFHGPPSMQCHIFGGWWSRRRRQPAEPEAAGGSINALLQLDPNRSVFRPMSTSSHETQSEAENVDLSNVDETPSELKIDGMRRYLLVGDGGTIIWGYRYLNVGSIPVGGGGMIILWYRYLNIGSISDAWLTPIFAPVNHKPRHQSY